MCKGLRTCDWNISYFPPRSQVKSARDCANMDLAKLAVIVSLLTLISVQLGKS